MDMDDEAMVVDGRSVEKLSRHTKRCGSAANSCPGPRVGEGQGLPPLSTIVTTSAPAAMEVPEEEKMAEDRSLSGASSEPAVPLQGGAGEPGGTSVVTKMMMMMTGRNDRATPGTSAVPESSVPDLTSMLKGGMPFPDMASVMSGGAMSAMMNQGMMKGGPMQMAQIFECIIDMSLARADSDESGDDDEGATVELPCQYCCRCFSSQMTLKTHILVAHEYEDDSVLNLNQLTINSKGRSPKDRPQNSRRPSQDIEVFASGLSAKSSGQNGSESVPPCADFSAAECVRGVKRGRTESRDLDTVEKGGASGMEDIAGEEHHPTRTSQPQPAAVLHTLQASASKDPDGVISQQNSAHTCKGLPSQSRPKKTKTKRHFHRSGWEEAGKYQHEDSAAPTSFRPGEAAGTKQAANVEGVAKGGCGADRWSADRWRAGTGPQAAAAAGPDQAGESPVAARRSLRSRKSTC